MSVATTIGKGIAWNTIATVIGRVVIFVNLFIILRSLSVYEYGLSELVFSTVSTLGIVLLPGLSTAILADLSVERARKDYGRMKSIFLQFTTLNLLLGILAWAILFFGSTYAAQLAGNVSIGFFLKIVSFSFLASPIRTAATMLAGVELRFRDLSFYTVVEEIAKGIFLAIFLLVLHKDLEGLLLASVLSQFVAAILFIPRTLSAYRTMQDAVVHDMGAFWEMLRHHRKWSIASSYINSLISTAQLWMIRFLLGTEAVGLYAFASGILNQVTAFLPMSAILGPLAPQYVERKEELIRLIKASAKLQLVASVVLMAVAFTLLPILVIIFPKYLPSLPLTRILLLSLMFSSFAALFTPIFAALKEQLSLFLSISMKLIFTLILFPICIYAFGIAGIGVATIAVFIATTIERYIRLARMLPGFSFTLRDLFTIEPEERTVIRMFLSRMRETALVRLKLK